MLEDKQLSSMIIETYANTKILVETVKGLSERAEKHDRELTKHEQEIIKIKQTAVDLSTRVAVVEDYQSTNDEVVENARTAIRLWYWVVENKIKSIVITLILPVFFYTFFVLWFIDPLAIDVKPLRNISTFLLDPAVDSLAGRRISHDNTFSNDLQMLRHSEASRAIGVGKAR